MQLNDELIDVQSGDCILIRPGTRHRAIGQMKVLIVVFPLLITRPVAIVPLTFSVPLAVVRPVTNPPELTLTTLLPLTSKVFWILPLTFSVPPVAVVAP